MRRKPVRITVEVSEEEVARMGRLFRVKQLGDRFSLEWVAVFASNYLRAGMERSEELWAPNLFRLRAHEWFAGKGRVRG